MIRHKLLIFMTLLTAAAGLVWGVDMAQAGPGIGVYADGTCGNPTFYANSPSGTWMDACGNEHASGGYTDPVTGVGGMRKFVDPLPGLGGSTYGIPVAGANNIPIAIANTPYGTPYADADYYEIGIVEYTQQMHADLPGPTRLRGYVQLVPGLSPDGTPYSYTDVLGNVYTSVQLTNLDGTPLTRNGVTYYGVTTPTYLGPMIIATKGKAVRIKYTNLLPTGAAGNLFIPVDHTLMGAGLGPDNMHSFSENRIVTHLHGGYTPWVSDGTPWQWTVPVGENLPQTWQMQGASFEDVPDMENPGQGSGTLYYTNEQASRLMFYHDHAVGITRLNVYAGLAAGYLIQDTGGPLDTSGASPSGEWTLPIPPITDEIPLVIQDKTFVPADVVNGAGTGQDEKWDTANWGPYGELWFPHVYETNQDPISPHAIDGTNPVGRWDWGPWFWPVFPSQFPLPDGTYGGGETTTPEAFMDTPVINGVAYPTVTLDPKAYRLRILNAANDRMINLGLYVAEPVTIALVNGGSGYTSAPTVAITDTSSTCPTTGTATVSVGTVTDVALTNNGSGYTTTTPLVTILAPLAGGTPATARAVVGNMGTTVGAVTGIVITNPGSGYTSADAAQPTFVTIDPPTSGTQALATATVAPAGVITGITVATDPTMVCNAPMVSITGGGGSGVIAYATAGTEVKMVNFDTGYVPPAIISPDGTPYFPTAGGLMGTGWGQADGRVGGVPDPAFAGPPIIQIGTDSGLLPAPAIIPSTPINYEYNKRSVTVLNVLEHGLFLGPAERADAVVDLCNYAGQTLLLYNDSPAPVPAGDPRLDYYTGGPDQSAVGGAASTLPGYGPNMRTIMQIKVNPGACDPYNPTPLYAALPAAYGATQKPPIVGESVYNPAFGTSFIDNYALIYTGSAQQPLFTFEGGAGGSVSSINLTSAVNTVVSVNVTGAGYTTAPAVTIAAPPPGGTQATATNATLSVTNIQVTNGGSGYTSAPTVTLSASPAGPTLPWTATATAAISNKKVVSVTVTNPGWGYVTMPTVTFTGGGGKNAAATATGGVTAPTPTIFVPSGILLTNGGSGYTSGTVAVTIAPPTPPNGVTAVAATADATVSAFTALAPLNKAIQELFEPVYGRMNATLGVELPFTNSNNQTTIPLGYVDPPTEILRDGETQIWKITHNGVDTHPVHFHLMDVQLINRVGWDGTVKPPPANEVGWKETIRMNPLEDIIVAVRAVAPKFNFGLPESMRPMAPSEPLGSTAGFTQIDPATGNPMVVANAIQNFGWEYVWHCHILGHEENDFMRPVVFQFASTVPGAPTFVAAPDTTVLSQITLTWNDTTPVATALGNPANEIGFTVQRSTNSNFNQNLVPFNAPANSTGFIDTTVAAGTRYYYRVQAYNAAGSSAWLSWARVTAQ